jgi:putative transposase
VLGKTQSQKDPSEARPPAAFRLWHQRGYLPHRDESGLRQFVTFRLADAFPGALRSEWTALFKIEENRRRLRRLEEYLDLGRGEGHLRLPELARLVENALRYFHGSRYRLGAWVIMPNHVHVLFTPTLEAMSKIVQGWKSYTAKQANRMLHRSGPFWEEDYWDTYMRNEEHEARTCRYIEQNPLKANLAREPDQWPWSSARFRDEYGRLRLPDGGSQA